MVEKLEFIGCLVGSVVLLLWILANLGLFAGMFAVIAKKLMEEHEANRDK